MVTTGGWLGRMGWEGILLSMTRYMGLSCPLSAFSGHVAKLVARVTFYCCR